MPIERHVARDLIRRFFKDRYRQRSPRLQVASAKWAARLVLPDPAVPTPGSTTPVVAVATEHRIEPRDA
jgi:hypothetical protein